VLPVDLASLSTQQLSQVKKQLDDELEHLTNSFSQLRAAQAKFRECLKSIAGGVNSKVDSELPILLLVLSVTENVGIEKPILVPLTSSLYVPGTLADTNNVIVDVGTGFYVEKVGSDIQAQTFAL
jgi:prefoldin alpha subunit